MFIFFFLFILCSRCLDVVFWFVMIVLLVRLGKLWMFDVVCVSRCVVVMKKVVENVICVWCVVRLVVMLYLRLMVLFCMSGMWFCDVIGMKCICRLGLLVCVFIVVIMCLYRFCEKLMILLFVLM